MNNDSRPIEQIFPFACRFNTFGRRFKLKVTCQVIKNHIRGVLQNKGNLLLYAESGLPTI